MQKGMPFSLSSEDEKRFGIRSAKASLSDVSEVRPLMDFCRSNQVRFLIARVPVDETGLVHALEDEGMRLMDTLVFFSRSLQGWSPPPLPPGIVIAPLRSEDIAAVRMIAEEAFRGYRGHYQNDPRLDIAQSDAVYIDWSIKSCHLGEYANQVLLGRADGAAAGYMTFRIKSQEEGEAVIGGVLDSARKRGMYRALLSAGLQWLNEQGVERATLSTQIFNTSVQKVWTRLGFEPHHALYTFHGWF